MNENKIYPTCSEDVYSPMTKLTAEWFGSKTQCESTISIINAFRETGKQKTKSQLPVCCFQAMFDEYLHLMTEAAGFSDAQNRAKQIQDTMLTDLRIHTASYDVDTYSSFRSRIGGAEQEDDDSANKMRAHYAVGFVNTAYISK